MFRWNSYNVQSKRFLVQTPGEKWKLLIHISIVLLFTQLNSTQLQSSSVFALLLDFVLGRDKSCLNLTLLLNTHRYQLKVPLRPVFLFVAGKSLHPDIPPLVLHCIAMQLHFIQCPFVALSCIDLVTRFWFWATQVWRGAPDCDGVVLRLEHWAQLPPDYT